MAATKIATCCYCGTRAALVLRGKDRHELQCGTCGAPLHAMKMLRAETDRCTPVKTVPHSKTKRPRVEKYPERDVPRPKKRRKRKSFGRKVFSELWDVLEDVIDDVFD